MQVSLYNDGTFSVHMHCPDIPLKLIKWWLVCILAYASSFGNNASFSDHFKFIHSCCHSVGTVYHTYNYRVSMAALALTACEMFDTLVV